jgi:hypothetical protein
MSYPRITGYILQYYKIVKKILQDSSIGEQEKIDKIYDIINEKMKVDLTNRFLLFLSTDMLLYLILATIVYSTLYYNSIDLIFLFIIIHTIVIFL